jgi:hypothetical protein
MWSESTRDQKKFTEPVALSSPEPIGFPLPRTAPGLGFDLLALRSRCKQHTTGDGKPDQDPARQDCRKMRTLLFCPLKLALRAGCSRQARTRSLDRPNAPDRPWDRKFRRAGGGFVHRARWLSASAYGLQARIRPTHAPCSAQPETYAARGCDSSPRNREKAALCEPAHCPQPRAERWTGWGEECGSRSKELRGAARVLT